MPFCFHGSLTHRLKKPYVQCAYTPKTLNMQASFLDHKSNFSLLDVSPKLGDATDYIRSDNFRQHNPTPVQHEVHIQHNAQSHVWQQKAALICHPTPEIRRGVPILKLGLSHFCSAKRVFLLVITLHPTSFSLTAQAWFSVSLSYRRPAGQRL